MLIPIPFLAILPGSAVPRTTSCGTIGTLQNGGFESPTVIQNSATYQYFNTGTAQLSWQSTNNSVELWRNPTPVSGRNAAEGVQLAELNSTNFGGLYQDITTTPGQRILWQLKHRGRDGTESMRVLIGTNSGTTSYTATSPATSLPGTLTIQQQNGVDLNISDGTSSWGTWSGNYLVPTGQTTTRFLFVSFNPSSGGSGNLLDDIIFEPFLACPVERSVTFGTPDVLNVLTTDGVTYGAGHELSSTQNAINPSGSVGTVSTSSSAITFTPNTAGSNQTLDYTISVTSAGTTYTDEARITYNVSATVPGAPTSLSATRSGSQVALSWTAPTNNGGVAISDYVVEFQEGSGSWQTFSDGVSSSTSATITGLTGSNNYNFRVSAKNDGSGYSGPGTTGTSAPSSVLAVLTQTITFSGASSAYATETVNLTAATTTSGLSISYTSANTDICTVSSSAVVTLISRGTCSITASQAGNDEYFAATPVTQSFTSNFGAVFVGVVTSCTGIGQLENGSFETFNLGSPAATWQGFASGPQQVLFLDTDAGLGQSVSPWDTGASNKIIELQRVAPGQTADTAGTSGHDAANVPPQDGTVFAELNATEVSYLFQDVSTLPGSVLRWEIFHRGRGYTAGTSGDGDVMKVQIGATNASGFGSSSSQTIDQTPGSGFDVDGTAPSGSISGTQIKTERSDGWQRVRGVYQVPTGQTTTRFAFSSVSAIVGSTVGNLLDNISFTPNVACPFTKSIISGRTATINVFGDDVLTDSEESIAGTDSTIANTISVTSGSGSVTRANSNRSMQFTAPGSTGTSVVRFRVANSFGDTADADATFNIVTDLTHVAPTVIPVDPRATFVDLPQVDVVGNSVSKAMVCFVQTDSSGNTLGTPNLNVQVRTAGNASLSTSAATTSEVSINGSIADVESASNSVRISNSTASTAVLNTNASKFIRVRTSGDDDVSSENCANGTGAGRQQIIELRPVQLETTRRLGITVD